MYSRGLLCIAMFGHSLPAMVEHQKYMAKEDLERLWAKIGNDFLKIFLSWAVFELL